MTFYLNAQSQTYAISVFNKGQAINIAKDEAKLRKTVIAVYELTESNKYERVAVVGPNTK